MSDIAERIVGHRSTEINPNILMLTFDNLARRMFEKITTDISSFEFTQILDYAMKLSHGL